MAEREEELKSLLKKVKKESKKAGLKLNIKTTTTTIKARSSLHPVLSLHGKYIGKHWKQ